MTSVAVRADFFDASALVKVYVSEPKSDVVRPYFQACTTKYTTPFCFYEALNVLKAKWLYRRELTRDEYLDAAFRLTAWYGAATQRIEDLDFTVPTVFATAKRLVEQKDLDLSDAFQIVSVKHGYFSRLVNHSQTVLTTADKRLAVAARAEGLRVWSVMEEPPPDVP